jgi:rubrerythrin
MAKFKAEELLNDLRTDVERIKEAVAFFKDVEKTKLIYQPKEGKWSIVQVLEHLNAYGRYYIPAMEKAITEKKTGKQAWFTPGFWGNFFTNSMKPKNVYEIKNKMKAAKAFSFPNSLNVDTVLAEFNQQQDSLIRLLDMAQHVDLNEIRLPVTISKVIRLKLGDVFRFLIAHEQRHMIQARNTLNTVGITTDKFPVILQVAPR